MTGVQTCALPIYAVAEVNAFGDLLPGVLDDDGRDTYGAQIAAVTAGRHLSRAAAACAI